MKSSKKFFVYGSSLVVLLGVLSVSFVKDTEIVPNINTKNRALAVLKKPVDTNVKETDSISSIKIKNTNTDKIVNTMYTQASFRKEYTIEEMISNAEIIAYGKVDNLKNYVNVGGFFDGNIFSKFDFKIEDILKGDIEELSIPVVTPGGMLSQYEFFVQNQDYISKKMSSDQVEFEKERLYKARDTEYIEEIFAGVENINDNEDLLLFLSYDEEEDNYYIVGTSRFGKLNYDKDNDEFYQTTIEESKRVKATMGLNLKDLENLIEQSEDNSLELKQQRLEFKDDKNYAE